MGLFGWLFLALGGLGTLCWFLVPYTARTVSGVGPAAPGTSRCG